MNGAEFCRMKFDMKHAYFVPCCGRSLAKPSPKGQKPVGGLHLQPTLVRQAGEGGGVMGWVIRIIFDPNSRQ